MKRQGGVAKKQGKQKRMVVSVRHVVSPDAEARFCRAIDILLKAGVIDSSPNVYKTTPVSQVPTDEALSGEGENGCESQRRRVSTRQGQSHVETGPRVVRNRHYRTYGKLRCQRSLNSSQETQFKGRRTK